MSTENEREGMSSGTKINIVIGFATFLLLIASAVMFAKSVKPQGEVVVTDNVSKTATALESEIAQIRGELKELRDKQEAEELAAKAAELEALKARVQEFEGNLPKTVEEALGKPGAGVTMNTDLADPNTAVIYSMYGPLSDRLLGEIYLPNKNEGRGFLVEIDGPFPKFVRANQSVVIPEGFVPMAHPDRIDQKTGLYLLVWARPNALVKRAGL